MIAAPDALESTVEVRLEKDVEAGQDVPMIEGVTVHGDPWTLTADRSVLTAADAPLFLLLPVPSEANPDHLAVAFLDPLILMDGLPGEPPLEGAWGRVPGAVVDDHLIVALHGVGPDPAVLRIIEHETFNSRNEPVEPAARFEAQCEPELHAKGRCSLTVQREAEQVLEDGLQELVKAGFTSEPRLQRSRGGYTVSGFPNPKLTWEDGAYLFELQSLKEKYAGRYIPGTSMLLVVVHENGITPYRAGVLRHELIHAVQFAYHLCCWGGKNLWVIEGQTTFMEDSFRNPARRSARGPRDVDLSFWRTRFDGPVDLGPPWSAYQAQDFYAYLYERFNEDNSFLVPFMEQGLTAGDVDKALRSHYPTAFGADGFEGGLPAAYWAWARNQAYEQRVNIFTDAKSTCELFEDAIEDLRVVDITPDNPRAFEEEELPPLTTRVRLVHATGDPFSLSDRVRLSITPTTQDESRIRNVIYRANFANCHLREDMDALTVYLDDEPQSFVILTANTDWKEPATYTFAVESEPQLVITSPTDDHVFLEQEGAASLDLNAAFFPPSDVLASDVTIEWSYLREGDSIANDVPLGTSKSGETITTKTPLPCEPLRIRASVRLGTGIDTSEYVDVHEVTCEPTFTTLTFQPIPHQSGYLATVGEANFLYRADRDFGKEEPPHALLVGDDGPYTTYQTLITFDYHDTKPDLEPVAASLAFTYDTKQNVGNMSETRYLQITGTDSPDIRFNDQDFRTDNNRVVVPFDPVPLTGLIHTIDISDELVEMEELNYDPWHRTFDPAFLFTLGPTPNDGDETSNYVGISWHPDRPTTLLHPTLEVTFRNH